MPDNRLDTDEPNGEHPCGRRPMKVYPVAEFELDALVWLPFWARRKMLRRIKAETIHEDEELS